ncbi:hypothetical protein MANI_003337 [Metarhizium anisopliae]|nr:hypothetical protein MANI_003337 [Metarhizium anisopliae]
MATQCAQLVVMEDGVNFFPADDVSKHEPTCPETMEEYDTFKLDEQDVVLAQEAGRQRFNKNEVRPNMYSFDWSDAHGALWDRVKQKIITRFGTQGARLDRVKTKAVSVAGGGGIRAVNRSMTIAIPTQEVGFETEILIQALQPRGVSRKPWRHNLCYALLQPGTVIGTQKDEISMLLATFELDGS